MFELEYNCDDMPEVVAKLAHLREGSGHQDMVNDLETLVDIAQRKRRAGEPAGGGDSGGEGGGGGGGDEPGEGSGAVLEAVKNPRASPGW